MKEQYQREVSQIHVPSELLLKTKQAMKEEAERLDGQRSKTMVIPFRAMSIAAAVLVAVAAIPVISGYLKTESGPEMQKPGVQLAGTQQMELAPIAKGSSKENFALEETKTEGMPAEFADGEELTVAGKTVILTTDEGTGFWKAYYEAESLVITSEMTEREAFVEALGNDL